MDFKSRRIELTKLSQSATNLLIHTEGLSGDESALRLLLEITMGVNCVEPEGDHALIEHSFQQLLIDQAMAEPKRSLFGSIIKNRSRRGSVSEPTQGPRLIRSDSQSDVDQSVYESDTSADSSVQASEDEDDDKDNSTQMKKKTLKSSFDQFSAEDLDMALRKSFDKTQKSRPLDVVSQKRDDSNKKDLRLPLSLSLSPPKGVSPRSMKNIHDESDSRNISRAASPRASILGGPSKYGTQSDLEKAMIDNNVTRIENANLILNSLDDFPLSALILILALFNPKYDDAKNYVVITSPTLSTPPQIIRRGQCPLFNEITNNDELESHSVLFCTEVMIKPLNIAAKERFLKINLESLLFWISKIKENNKTVSFTEVDLKSLYINLRRMQTLIKLSEHVTLLDLLPPKMIPHYRELFKTIQFAKDRHDKSVPAKASSKNKTVRTQNNSLSHSSTQHEVMLRTLQSVSEQWETIPAACAALIKGDKKSFLGLSIKQCKEAAIAQLDLRESNRYLDDALEYCLTEHEFSPHILTLRYWHISETKLIKMLKKNGASLTWLDLSYCKNVTSKTLKTISDYCKNLQTLILRGTGLTTLSENHPHLIHLDLSECNQLTDDAVKKISKCCPELQTLSLNKTPITKVNLARINVRTIFVNECPNLRSIYTNVHGRGKKSLDVHNLTFLYANHCTELKRILLPENADITGVFADNNTSLEEVIIPRGVHITHLSFDYCTLLNILKVNHPATLRVLNLQGCHNLSHELSESLNLFLLDLVIGSKFDETDPKVAGNALTILNLTKDNFKEWAFEKSCDPYFDKWISAEEELDLSPRESRGELVFNGIKVEYFNLSYGNFTKVDFYGAELLRGICHMTDLTDASLCTADIDGTNFGQKKPFEDHGTSMITCMKVSSNGKLIATADRYNNVIVRNEDKILFSFPHTGVVNSLSFSSDNTMLLTGGTFKDPEVKSRKQHYEDRKNPTQIVNMKSADDKGKCFDQASDNKVLVNVWNLDTEVVEGIKQNTIKPLTFTLLSPRSNSAEKEEIENHPALLHSFYTHSVEIQSVSFSPCDKYIASSDENCVRIREHQTGLPKVELRLDKRRVTHTGIYSFVYHPSGDIIITGGLHDISIWDVESGNLISQFRAHDSKIYSLAFSLDGCSLVTGSDDKTVKLWNNFRNDEHRIHKSYRGHSGQISGVAIFPDNSLLASIDHNEKKKQLIVWDVESKKTVLECDHPTDINSVSIKPSKTKPDEGWEVLTAGNDGLTRRWLVTGTPIKRPMFCGEGRAELKMQGCDITGTRGVSKDIYALFRSLKTSGEPNLVASKIHSSTVGPIAKKPTVLRMKRSQIKVLTRDPKTAPKKPTAGSPPPGDKFRILPGPVDDAQEAKDIDDLRDDMEKHY